MNKIQFDRLLKPLIEIYDDIELDLINNILDRIENYKNVQGSLEWYLDKLAELGVLENDNLKILKKNKSKIEKILKEIVNNAGRHKENLELLTTYHEKGLLNVNPVEIYNSESINNLVNNALNDSKDILELINTKAIEGANQTYKYIINKAYVETASGVYTYTESIRKALNEMAEIGIQTVHYKSGRSIGIEAAVRRDVITRMNKLVGDVELKHCEELGTNLVYVDQHLGARVRTKYTKNDYETHAEWQGKKYMIDGSNDKYGNLYEKTGYGEMLGLKGINCYHNMRPTWEWEEVPNVIDEVVNKEKYELYQQQRAYERKIRKLKRKRFVSKKTNDSNYENINNEYQELSKKFNNWLKENGLNRDYAREYVSENIENYNEKEETRKKQKNIVLNDTNKELSENYKLINQQINDRKIKSIIPKPLEEKISTEEIIKKVGGGDLTTGGSCTSVSYAYIGNKYSGLDVLDFRGGVSCEYFSRDGTIRKIIDFDGVVSKVEYNINDYTSVKNLLKEVKPDKEYLLSTGKHTAIIRKKDKTFEYLELQEYNNNGFKKLNDKVLKDRFGCKKTHSSYGVQMPAYSELIDVESLGNSEEFKNILNYINTSEKSQKKGFGGHAK